MLLEKSILVGLTILEVTEAPSRAISHLAQKIGFSKRAHGNGIIRVEYSYKRQVAFSKPREETQKPHLAPSSQVPLAHRVIH